MKFLLTLIKNKNLLFKVIKILLQKKWGIKLKQLELRKFKKIRCFKRGFYKTIQSNRTVKLIFLIIDIERQLASWNSMYVSYYVEFGLVNGLKPDGFLSNQIIKLLIESSPLSKNNF